MLNNTMKSLKTKKSSKKGFTLMEMLIVVAIIAILVAIAIPTFNGALNKAKVGADEANVRAWYAEQMVTLMTDDTAKAPTTYNGETLQAPDAKVVVAGDTADTLNVTYTSSYNKTSISFGKK